MENIYQRLNEVRKKVAYVQKDSTITVGGSYMAVSHDQVTAATRNELIAHGILTVPRLVSSEVKSAGQTSRGTEIIRYEATFDVAFVNIEMPSDSVIMPVEAHANDTGDKAPGKALSYAVKYAILKILNLETGEDDEGRTESWADASGESSKPISEAQQLTIKAKLETAERDMGRFLRWAKVESLDQIPVKAYDLCIKTLDNAIEAKERDAQNQKKEQPGGDTTVSDR